MESTGVRWPLMIGLMVVLLAYFLGMVWFQVYEGVSAIPENGYEIQGQNCVPRLQGRVLWVWLRYRNFMLVIWCFRWIVSDTFMWPNEHSGDSQSFPRMGDFSNLILWTLCQNAIGAETEDLILFFGPLGAFYLLAGGWRWHGAKSCKGPAEFSPNVFVKKHECTFME